MKAIGICLVVYGVVQALAGLAKDERSNGADSPKHHDPRDDDEKGGPK